jgi:RNA polymerase sigma factor (sigma-70 family)
MQDTADMSEHQLLARAGSGDREAYAMLYSRALPGLLKALCVLLPTKEEAEDMAQDLVIKLFEKKDILTALKSIEDYLFIMAKNAVIDYQRHRIVKDRVISKLAELHRSGPVADEELIYKNYHEAATTAINRLSEKKKSIFLLRTQTDMTLEEIAAKMDMSLSGVKKALYEATASIREYLRENQAFPALLLFLILAETLY